MKREFVTKTLKYIKSYQKGARILYKLGIILDNEDAITLLEEAIVLSLTSDEEKYERLMDDILWWLYEDVEKVVTYEKREINLENVEDYVDWLYEFYEMEK